MENSVLLCTFVFTKAEFINDSSDKNQRSI